MTLDDVKAYLRIDEDADDMVLEVMMQAAEQYIKDAVGFYEEENPKIKMLYWLVIQDFYENRVLVVKEADKQRLSYVVSSIVMQLQTEALLKEGEPVG